jgi:Na+-driven multidrug efflux pump
VRGAAVATVAARAVNAAVCLYGLRAGWGGLRLKLSHFRPDWPLARKTMSVGLPAAVGNCSNAVGIAVFQAMVNSLGTTVMGAVIIGFRIIQLFNVPAMALSWAAAPVVGQALGAGKKRLARRAVNLSAGLVAAILLLPVIALTIWGKYVALAFTDSTAVIEQAQIFFRVVPASMYCFSVLLVLLAAYYGSGHTRPAMVIHIVRLWILRLPVSYVLAFVLGMGSIGIYLGMVFGNVITALIAFALYRTGGWEEAVAEETEQ